MNTLVQPTAGESVLIPMVARGEIDLGIANMLEVLEGIETGKLQNDLRIIGSIYTLRIGLFARKDTGMTTIADLKGKRVPAGYSAMRTLDQDHAGDARDRRADLERRQAGAGAERDPRRRRFHRRRRPTCSCSRSAPRRCARSTPPSAACARSRSDEPGRHRSQPQDLPVRLSRRGRRPARSSSASRSR